MKQTDKLFKELEEVLKYRKYEFIEDISSELTNIISVDNLVVDLIDFFSLKYIDVDNIYKLFDVILFKKKSLIKIKEESINFLYTDALNDKINILVIKNELKVLVNIDLTTLNEVKIAIDNKIIVVDFSLLFQQYLFEKIVSFLNSDIILVDLIDLFSSMNINEMGFDLYGKNKIYGFVYFFNNKINFLIDKNSNFVKVGNFQMSL